MEAGGEEFKKGDNDNDEEPGVEVKERDIEVKEEVAENDGSEEKAERAEKEKIYQKMKVLQEKVREVTKQKEDIAATAFKQAD